MAKDKQNKKKTQSEALYYIQASLSDSILFFFCFVFGVFF